MNFKRPYINQDNLENGRLPATEYQKALEYVTNTLPEQIFSTESLNPKDEDLLNIFDIGKEMHSFLDTLPRADLPSLMRKIFFSSENFDPDFE